MKVKTLKDGDYFTDVNKTNRLKATATRDFVQYCPNKCFELDSNGNNKKKNGAEYKVYYAYHQKQPTGVTCY